MRRLQFLFFVLAAGCGSDDGDGGIDPAALDLDDVDSWPRPPLDCEPLPIVCPTGTVRHIEYQTVIVEGVNFEYTVRTYGAPAPVEPNTHPLYDYCAPEGSTPGDWPDRRGYVNTYGPEGEFWGAALVRSDGAQLGVNCFDPKPYPYCTNEDGDRVRDC